MCRTRDKPPRFHDIVYGRAPKSASRCRPCLWQPGSNRHARSAPDMVCTTQRSRGLHDARVKEHGMYHAYVKDRHGLYFAVPDMVCTTEVECRKWAIAGAETLHPEP
eukprot:3937155-Rhodomonas_salina.2